MSPIQAARLRPSPVLALDLGGTHLRVAVVDDRGHVHAHRRIRTPLADGGPAILAAAVEALRATRDEHISAGGTAPVALGISAPGPLDPRRGVTFDPPNMGPSFRDLPLGPELGAALTLPWALEKDTHVAVLGEAAFGAGRETPDDLVYLTVSTGIGGGVITGGRLLSGPDGVAGELGHLVVDMDGPVCGCGAAGHLEGIASGSGMARAAAGALAAGEHAPELARLAAELAPAPLEAVHVDRAAAAGDPVALRIVERSVRAFAAAVVSIVDVFDPDRVIVGGGIAMSWGDRLLGPAREAVARTAFTAQARRVRIVPAELGDDVGLIGTVALVASALPPSALGAHIRDWHVPTGTSSGSI